MHRIFCLSDPWIVICRSKVGKVIHCLLKPKIRLLNIVSKLNDERSHKLLDLGGEEIIVDKEDKRVSYLELLLQVTKVWVVYL
jgi:hypothetical protein